MGWTTSLVIGATAVVDEREGICIALPDEDDEFVVVVVRGASSAGECVGDAVSDELMFGK